MAIWSGIGINYGHQAVYDTSIVESDFTFLKSQGITRLRIAFPGYSNSASIANCQDMVARALAHGFSVAWGVSTGTGNGAMNATTWNAYKSYVAGSLASWAQSNALPELSVGNECDIQCDGTTLTSATVRADIRALCTTVKGIYTGVVSYQTSPISTYRVPWTSEGIGTLDLFGWNSYDTFSAFDSRNIAIIAAFGSKSYISEFGSITNGYSDYTSESDWYYDVLARIASLQSAGVSSGYFFCYRDGGFGLTADTFALQLSGGTTRTALYAVLGSLSTLNHGLYRHG